MESLITTVENRDTGDASNDGQMIVRTCVSHVTSINCSTSILLNDLSHNDK